jgi:type II secretory pathway predicted ATPase ExeA
MTEKNDNATALARILARTPSEKVITPKAWDLLVQDVVACAKASSGLLNIFGEVGSGKTSFAAILTTAAKQHVDVIAIAPASQIKDHGWLLKAIAPWLSSESNDTKAIQKKLSSLSETERSILIVIDGGDFIADDQLSGDLAAILNLSSHAGVKLAVVVLAAEQKLSNVLTDQRLAGKILLHRALPGLQTRQLIELIETKILAAGTAKGAITPTDVAKIAEQSLGKPLLALNLLARKLGLSVVATSMTSDHTKEAKVPTRQKHHTNDLIDIEDLLTPQKHGSTQK